MKPPEDSKPSDPSPGIPRYVLPVIVFAQFCGTSLWFASNGIMEALSTAFRLPDSALEHLTASVQMGFISGTLVFALFTLADRHSPSRVFFWSAVLGALFNLGMAWEGNTFSTLLGLRFATGFFLAGIYPVGMKIASDYYEKGLGVSLGYLVGALVLGTAFPHLLNSSGVGFSWKEILAATSVLALIGGLAIRFLPDGPYRRSLQKPDLTAFISVFKNRDFRSSAFGYFGHMWELYAFWAFVPLLLQTYSSMHPDSGFSASLWAFVVIGVGGPACVLGGYLSRCLGVKRVATASLALSALCCLVVPWALTWSAPADFLLFLGFWGMAVIADSPLFSTLVAQNADLQRKGTALTIVTSIGFAITIASIETLGFLQGKTASPLTYMLLAAGPVLGITALVRKP